MDFTFGIITDGNNDDRLNIIIDSIENEKIPNYEIIIVGGNPIFRQNTKHIPFEESIRYRWITKKKNLITENSSFENIVYLHDYIKLNEGWYNGFLEFGNDFKICMTKMIDIEGNRFRDWCLWFKDLYLLNNCGISNEEIDSIIKRYDMLIPYDITNLSKVMYISGAYWVAKKQVMLENPLNEFFAWGDGEDIEWSRRIRQKYNFSMNTKSSVNLLKEQITVFKESGEETIEILKKVK